MMVTTSDAGANAEDPALPDATARVESMQILLGVRFNDPRLLLQALLHRSAVLERQRDHVTLPTIASNERLEFLGDAVLSMLIAQYAYENFTDYDEGRLTEARAALVRRSTLAILADALGMAELLYVGRAERRPASRGRMTVLAEALEAVVAAVYLDQGLDVARQFVFKLLEGRIPYLLQRADSLNPKSRLQELAQSQLRLLPTYVLLSRTGPAHDSRFTVEAHVGEYQSTGLGTSKRDAEQRAAQLLLDKVESALSVPKESAQVAETGANDGLDGGKTIAR
jgi:ribonuclease-3